jgi:hypothetical protein
MTGRIQYTDLCYSRVPISLLLRKLHCQKKRLAGNKPFLSFRISATLTMKEGAIELIVSMIKLKINVITKL